MSDQVPPQWEQQPQAQPPVPQPPQQPQPMPQYDAAPQWGQAQPQQLQPQWGQPQQPPPQAQWGQPPAQQQPWGQQWQIPQQPGYGWPPPPPPKQRFQRKQVLAIVGVVVLAVVGGGVYAFNHFKTDMEVSPVDCNPSALTSCLVAKPSSSSPYTDSWGGSTTPSKDDYLKWAIDSDPVAQKTAGDNLTDEGLQNLAHTAWKASDGNGIDITLLRFSAPQGAHARALQLWGSDLASGDAVSVPVGVPGSAYKGGNTNSDGDIVTRYSASIGDITLQVRYYSPGKYSAADFGTWLSAEYQSLTKAPKPAASPQPTSVSQSVTCAGSLAACLVSAPSGSTPWSDTWGAASSPTAKQYSSQMFSDSTWQTIIAARLNAAGLTGITHRAWITSNGAEADDVLLSFSTANGALAWYKNDTYSATGTAFSIPNQKNASGTYNPKADSSNDIEAQTFGVSGTTAMELFTWSPKTFDQSRTVTWASQQLSKLATTANTQSAALAAVPTPTVSAAGSSSTCSSAQTCLIDAPSSSLPWSSTNYDKTSVATVQQYVEENWSGQAADEKAYEESLLNDAGVTAIAHREWDATDGTSAMLTILQYGSAKQAQAEALDYQGAILTTGTELNVPGLKNAIVDLKVMDAGGDLPVKIDLWKGSYEVRLAFYSPATANPQAAVSLALQQLAQLPGS